MFRACMYCTSCIRTSSIYLMLDCKAWGTACECFGILLCFRINGSETSDTNYLELNWGSICNHFLCVKRYDDFETVMQVTTKYTPAWMCSSYRGYNASIFHYALYLEYFNVKVPCFGYYKC